MYRYLTDKKLRSELRSQAESIIYSAQKLLAKTATFSFKLIGSGETRLMMVNGKNNSVDLDYNLYIQRDKENLVYQPGELKRRFMSAIQNVCGRGIKVSDSSSVITCHYGKVCGYVFSIDFAVYVSDDKGFQYKLIADKSAQPVRYEWNQVPKSKGFESKFRKLKQEGFFEDIKGRYLEKKNANLKQGSPKASFSLLIETVNELVQEHHISQW